ncbi:hypothetical protein BZA05DRAFT_392040 [Tricharina praecox]|uniref:uncharacterized protein n=1 Tax=Tricharina praecox TaxID=43433 RepID=UPI00221F0780|nr:uncharacterized protein BZA05DRAFT_392040 [Tricharina praecox]KAI5854605.1 hypothetical protein BZA05DRAFT_392040 [Tricharina praecox]
MSLDIAKSLVKTVARAFYDTRHILVLDALMVHNALRDDELAKLLGLVTKDVHKLCGKLKEDRMLAVHSRPEQKDGQQRPVNRTYYYIEFRSTIDGIKYRVYKLAELVRRSVNNGAETKGYVCPHCSKRFALLDAVTLEFDEAGLFLCDRCSNALVDDEESTETKLGHEKIQRMNRQIEKIERFLREVDTVQIPLNDFDNAIANSVPVPRDKNSLSSAQFVPVNGGKGGAGRPAQQQAIEISITSSSEKTADELRAEQLRKQQQAEKNALPVWHTQSTVIPGQITNAGIKEAGERAARERDGIGLARKEAEAEEKRDVQEEGSGGDAIAQYYAALAAQKAQEEADELEDDDSDDGDEDEDEEFEDLDIVSAPATNAATATGTPANNGESEEDEQPLGKRVKTEEPEKKVEVVKEEDSDEEVDFEDV